MDELAKGKSMEDPKELEKQGGCTHVAKTKATDQASWNSLNDRPYPEARGRLSSIRIFLMPPGSAR